MFFRLSSLELRPARLRDRARDDARGRRPGAAPARPRRGPARAGRRPPGGASRPRRAHPGLRPDTGRRAVRRPPGGRRPDGQRDRHDLPSRADPARADAHTISRRARAIHGCDDPPVEGGSRNRSGSSGDRGWGGAAALVVALRRRGARRRADRQRAAPLRRDVERDDRHADGAGLGAEQPCARRRARDRDRGRRRCARLARALPRNPHAGRDQRRPRSGPCLGAAADHVRPRPPGPWLVTVPDTPLVDVRASMELPPAAEGPS